MSIRLTSKSITAAFPKISIGLEKYLWLQTRASSLTNFYNDAEFRRKFNGFYRVRQGTQWQKPFYKLMAKAKGKNLSFSAILIELHKTTGRYEASFSSKLFATINPSAPIIDSIVLKNLGLRLPRPYSKNRAAEIVDLHKTIQSKFSTILKTADGRFLVREFRRFYPKADITKEKMLDLVLWQTRD